MDEDNGSRSIKDHKRQEELEIHDRRRPYGTGHLDDDDSQN